MSARRIDKLKELYKRASTEFIQKHTEAEGFILSITNAELSDKLNRLKIFFSVWPDQKEKDVLKSLESLKGGLRKELGERVKTKFVPQIEFVPDDSEKKRLRIEELLNKDK
ncbi:30S ribosome-binding factor RbfA [Candidatus Giovannonibacteria bacterium]|nr:30S ribosome-binding factor RbfA [Candidatus Giovannonibacteria bacterium]